MPSSEHQRGQVTPVGVNVQVDCSCGESYTVTLPLAAGTQAGPWDSGEFVALEHAQRAHEANAGNVSGLVHYVHDSDSAGASAET
jgi:hypothetical protein